MPHRPTFSLIVPTRERTDSLKRFLDSLAANTAHPERIEVIAVVDADDAASIAFRHDTLELRSVIVPPGQTMGALNQAGYEASRGEFVMLLNDDVVVRTRGWDERVLAQFRRFPDGILLVHVNDTLMRENLCTFPIVSRRFCEIVGGICPRDYLRYRIDDHIEDLFNLLFALGQRRAVYLPEVIFEHLNAVVMPEGHSEYHAEPATLAIDAERFLTLLPARKELALRLLAAIEGEPTTETLTARRAFLETITDPFALRTPARLRIHWDHPIRAHLRRWGERWEARLRRWFRSTPAPVAVP